MFLYKDRTRQALQNENSIYVLENGHLALSGKSEDLLADPEVKKAYLGG